MPVSREASGDVSRSLLLGSELSQDKIPPLPSVQIRVIRGYPPPKKNLYVLYVLHGQIKYNKKQTTPKTFYTLYPFYTVNPKTSQTYLYACFPRSKRRR